jgi:hypothetical protein
VTRHECLRAVQREALRQAEHLFASLLRRAFNGGPRPRRIAVEVEVDVSNAASVTQGSSQGRRPIAG